MRDKENLLSTFFCFILDQEKKKKKSMIEKISVEKHNYTVYSDITMPQLKLLSHYAHLKPPPFPNLAKQIESIQPGIEPK